MKGFVRSKKLQKIEGQNEKILQTEKAKNQPRMPAHVRNKRKLTNTWNIEALEVFVLYKRNKL